MLRYLSLAVIVVLSSAGFGAQNKEQERLENAGVVMQEILDVPDNIPQELLDKAECAIVIPTARSIVTGKGISVPASGRHLVDVLQKRAPRNDSTTTTRR